MIRLDEQRGRRAARQRLQPERARPRIQIEHGCTVEVDPCGQQLEERLTHPVGRRAGPTGAVGRAPAAEAARNDAGQLTTTSRSPPSTCAVADTAMRSTVPALGAVIAASIFIASMVAMVWPASTVSPSATATV